MLFFLSLAQICLFWYFDDFLKMWFSNFVLRSYDINILIVLPIHMLVYIWQSITTSWETSTSKTTPHNTYFSCYWTMKKNSLLILGSCSTLSRIAVTASSKDTGYVGCNQLTKITQIIFFVILSLIRVCSPTFFIVLKGYSCCMLFSVSSAYFKIISEL